MLYALLLALLLMPASHIGAQDYLSSSDVIDKESLESKEDSVGVVLNDWMKTRTQLNVADPELGFSFIKLATDYEMDEYYEVANIMYKWALSAPLSKNNKNIYSKELERLYPILSTKEYRTLKKMLKKDNPDFGKEVKKIWDIKDPTPMTNYNERLIEHWERINHSIEKFADSTRDVIEADDRAEIYIKYGEPDRIEGGFLRYNSSEINSYIKARYGITTNQLQAGVDSRMETQVRRLHNEAEYKIWVYDGVNKRNNDLFYIFGQDYNYKNFTLKKSISDFIPRSAFGKSRKNTEINIISSNNPQNSGGSQESNVLRDAIQKGGAKTSVSHPATPALLLMLSYSNQLSADVGFYGRFHNKLYNDYVDVTRNISGTMDIEYHNIERNYVKRIDSFSPPEISREKEKIPQINNTIETYRFLDNNSEPYVYVMAKSDLNSALMMDLRKNEQTDISLSDYKVKHGMTGYTQDKELYFRNSIEAKLYSLNSDKKIYGESVFKVYYPDKETRNIVFSSEFHNTNSETNPVANTSFKKSLRGLGNTTFNLPEPLKSNDPLISDVILGFNYKPGSSAQFPFNISTNNTIPQDKNLVFYFETYKLESDTSGIYKGNLTYTLKKKKEGFNLFKNKKENLSITLNLQAEEPYYKDAIEIDTDKLSPGHYELILNLETGKEHKFDRKIEFEVVQKK